MDSKTRRTAPQTAPGGPRPKTDTWTPTDRPFTTIGNSLLELEATQQSIQATSLPPSSQSRSQQAKHVAVSSDSTAGEFDVRKFLLDQKGSQLFHKSSLFRASVFAEQQSELGDSHLRGTSSIPSTRSTTTKKLLPKMDLSASKSVGSLLIPESIDDDPASSRLQQKSKKQLVLPNGRARLSTNQVQDDEHDGVSHFYTIEKLSESCCHAVQSKNKTWHFLPGSEERGKASNGVGNAGGNGITGVERPSRRVDVLDLDKCFDLAMQFANKKNQWDVACDEKLARIDRDFTSIQTKVAAKYEMYSNALERTDGIAAIDRSGDQKALAKLLFEQKWSDVILGELEAMLMISFLEQGVVLRKARIKYAQAFYHLERMYAERWNDFMRVLKELEQVKQEVLKTNEAHARDTKAMREHYEKEIKRLNLAFESRSEEMERKLTESKDQMAKMGDTMKTLNTIFKQMREDTEKVKAVELRENYIKLEKQHQFCVEELERLRPFVQQNQELHEQMEALQKEQETYKSNLANMDILLASKDEMIAKLMEQQSDLLAAQELQAIQIEELRKQAETVAVEDDEDEDGHHDVTLDQRRKSPFVDEATQQGGNRSDSFGVCVRCKQNMRESMSTRGEVSDVTNQQSSPPGTADDENLRSTKPVKKKRIQCLYFRILLPNLRGRRPQRDIEWTFCCMRSILFAKQIDDAMCRRSDGAFPLRIRMPEFVYAWFSPWRSVKEEKDLETANVNLSSPENESTMSTIEALTVDQLHAQADEDRWCLYYGVKSLVQEGYLEAKLFLSLLDEGHGEDELVFMLYCYRILDSLMSGRLDWGPLRKHVAYGTFTREYDCLYGKHAPTESKKLPHIPKTIWITPYHASLATGVVLSKATEAERAVLDKKIMEYVVTNVPEEDRPGVVLTSSTTNATSSSGREQKKGHRHVQQHTRESEDAEDGKYRPQQFIDAHLWIELMMLEYKEEQAHRRAAIRLMFQTATSLSSSASGGSVANGGTLGCTMDMEQFRIMLRTLNDEIPSHVVAILYRNAYVAGNGAVTFDAFMEIAESAQFFSTCMRLQGPASGIAQLASTQHSAPSAVQSTSARALYMVDKWFTILRQELNETVASLPSWSRNLTDLLSYEISSALTVSEGATSDGNHMLAVFYRLINTLLLVRLVKRETTGALFSSKMLFNINKALAALVECVRERDKTTVELIIDTVRQKLSVERVQTAFRKYLQRDEGTPLAMRPLLHRHHGSRYPTFKERRALRPFRWFQHAVSAILRESIKSHRIPSLLVELSGVSSVFHTHQQQYTSCTLNGGAGPAPKPIIMEVIYDFFFESFGSRWEAEKLIHDMFVNCRSFVRIHPLARLWSYLCSMSNTSPEDAIMGQNEALAFLHCIFRCGLHDFHLINPPATFGFEQDQDSDECVQDQIPTAVAQTILLTAFSRLGDDQKERLKIRLDEAATITPSIDDAEISSGTNNSAPTMDVDAFLVVALQEWRRYISTRMNEVRIACCALEDEMLRLEHLDHLDAVASVLQKAGITSCSEEVCIVYRRLCATERVLSEKQPQETQERMSDRMAAACFPLLAKETLTALLSLERAATESFNIVSNPFQSYEFLLSSWSGYENSCYLLLEELRRIGKNNDIRLDSLARRSAIPSSGTEDRDMLHSSSSSSVNALSSQDVVQLEAVYLFFLERLKRISEQFQQDQVLFSNSNRPRHRSNSVVAKDDGTLMIVDGLHARMVLVNETWTNFRQVLAGFSKLRALAALGNGPLPDDWDPPVNRTGL